MALGTMIDGVCIFEKPVTLEPNQLYVIAPGTFDCPECPGGFYKRGFEYPRYWLLKEPLSETITISYAIPRKTIPKELHYRKYSCPLEPGHYLTAQTFEERDKINKDSFAYPVNYF
ncbi:hypothetical protein DRO69_02230, partial [Candidatus Bathyarchaeota archaeon]